MYKVNWPVHSGLYKADDGITEHIKGRPRSYLLLNKLSVRNESRKEVFIRKMFV